jgi:hypothetical protein
MKRYPIAAAACGNCRDRDSDHTGAERGRQQSQGQVHDHQHLAEMIVCRLPEISGTSLQARRPRSLPDDAGGLVGAERRVALA